VPTVTLDGRKVDVDKGATILDAAHKAGVWIPTLCYHPSVSHDATCRLCMVELDRGDWRQLVTACNYPVRRDITVFVDSERAVAARRGVMELLLARAPGNEQLEALAARMGVAGTDLPTVSTAQRDCILCGLCTAVCAEVIGRSAISFAGRGQDRVVATPFRQPSADCIGCGACAVVCPVGTIQIRFHEDTDEIEISPFKTRAKLQKCRQCGAKIVSVPVATEVLRQFGGDWEPFRRRAQLCPVCRRKETVAAARAKTNPAPQGRPAGAKKNADQETTGCPEK